MQFSGLTAKSTCRQNTPMSTQPNPTRSNRQTLGISLPPETARAVKAEAAKRGISLRKLFQEMWSSYEEDRSKAGS